LARCKLPVSIRQLEEDPRRSGERLLRGTVPGICAAFGQSVEEVLVKAAQMTQVVARAKRLRGFPIDLAREIPSAAEATSAEIEVEI